MSLELLQKMAMREPSAPKPARLWLILHRLQEALSLRGTCPPGTFLTKVRALGWEYRICIRQPESLGSWLGGSLVDKRILNQGQWSECALSAELLPPPTSQLSPQHWRSAGSGCIVIDLGANIGACTLLFASMGHRVIAVEPEPSNLLMLHASLSLPQLETEITAASSVRERKLRTCQSQHLQQLSHMQGCDTGLRKSGDFTCRCR